MSAKTRLTLGAVGACWAAFAASFGASAPVSGAATPSADPAAVARGRYLVENVGMCADCHTPRDAKGQFVPGRWLQGSPLAFQPAVPMPWSPAAPAIAGLPSMTAEQAVKFMQTGTRADGSRPLPPMPEFRFDAADATAVVAYLKSLAQ